MEQEQEDIQFEFFDFCAGKEILSRHVPVGGMGYSLQLHNVPAGGIIIVDLHFRANV